MPGCARWCPAGGGDSPRGDPVPSPALTAGPRHSAGRRLATSPPKYLELGWTSRGSAPRALQIEGTALTRHEQDQTLGTPRVAVAGKHLRDPGAATSILRLPPPSRGTPGTRPHPAIPWLESLCPSHIPPAGGHCCPHVARRLSPAPLRFLLLFLFPFNKKKKEGGVEDKGPDVPRDVAVAGETRARPFP